MRLVWIARTRGAWFAKWPGPRPEECRLVGAKKKRPYDFASFNPTARIVTIESAREDYGVRIEGGK
jgi:hypothetical protein